MSVLLLGEKGYLGSYLLSNLKVDILKTRELYDNGNYYDYVINCIGKPDVNYCEKHEEETNYSNRDVILDIQKYYPKSKIINFTSYYVYNDEGLCTEESKVTYNYNYSKQKLEGEKLITNGVSFRIGKLFGNPLKKQNKLTDHILDNHNLKLDNIQFNPTSGNQILQVVKWELENNKLNGIFNLANKGITTHYEYGKFIDNFLSTNKNITQISIIDKGFDNYGKFVMSCDKINKYITLTPWQTDMTNYLIEWLQHKS
jgi:dTDP-4-dehydrorhamnose reductase